MSNKKNSKFGKLSPNVMLGIGGVTTLIVVSVVIYKLREKPKPPPPLKPLTLNLVTSPIAKPVIKPRIEKYTKFTLTVKSIVKINIKYFVIGNIKFSKDSYNWVGLADETRKEYIGSKLKYKQPNDFSLAVWDISKPFDVDFEPITLEKGDYTVYIRTFIPLSEPSTVIWSGDSPLTVTATASP